jgi:probable HAF family extracellular repeat protein
LGSRGQVWSEPFGINHAGQVVGRFWDGATEHGFIESGGIYTTLDDPAASHGTFATGINDAGQVVGWFRDDTTMHGFVESGGNYATLDYPASGETFAGGINDKGQIVGSFDGGAFIATPVPEPRAWAMMLMGLGLIGGTMRAVRRGRREALA